MFRYFISLSYQGTFFHGWQSQENSKSVQQEIENCLSLILKENIKITGCGRTDTGVHARFYVAHFDYRIKLSDNEQEKILKKTNKFLPQSIVIHEILIVGNETHARFDATKRTYKYFIALNKNPFLNDYLYECPYSLNIRLMELACMTLTKYKDFTSFSKTGSNNKTNICKIANATWEKNADETILIFTITADRFLRNMVRSIVGTMIDIGREKIQLQDFRNIIEAKNRSSAGVSIDAKGLFLWDIEYENIIFNKKISFFIE